MVLALPDRRSGKIVPTTVYTQLLQAARDIKPKHIGIDTSADAFGGNEIDRSQVRQFIGLLRQLAIAANGSVNLISHPSLTGIATDSGISGTTHWHNGMRARLYLTTLKKKADGNGGDRDGEQSTSGLRQLVFKKNNYGPISQTLLLSYHNGLYVREQADNFDQATRNALVDETFITLIRQLDAQHRPVSPKRNASNYAPTVFADHPDGKAFSKQDYAAAMERALKRGDIIVKTLGPRSRQVTFIALKDPLL
jgi:RecA-family ATPase